MHLLLIVLTLAMVPENAMPMRVARDGAAVEVGPGSVTMDGRRIELDEPVELRPTVFVPYAHERFESLPVFNPEQPGYARGKRLGALITQECTAAGLLLPETLRARTIPEGIPLERGVDYEIDPYWATLGRLEGGRLGEDDAVYVSYQYHYQRIDSIAADPAGRLLLLEGLPGVGVAYPPELKPGYTRLANLWWDDDELTADDLYPIDPNYAAREREPVADERLPKTLAKVRAGEPVKMVAWGDSVTVGGGVQPNLELRYQDVFIEAMRERFPKAEFELVTAGWGGRGSRHFFEVPEDDPRHFSNAVLAHEPDLVTIEFVNDAYLSEEAVQDHYGALVDLLEAAEAEVILITPHFVRPDWMGVDTLKVDEDPRGYTKGLRRFAEARGVALADAAARWGDLWRQGIPYITLLANSINHPDARGHRLFAEELLALFPER